MTTATRNVVTTLITLISLFVVSPLTYAAGETSFGQISAPLSLTGSGDYTLGLNIGGQSVTLVMSPSSVVGSSTRVVNLNGYPQQSSLRSFQGAILGEDNSWVRLGVHNDSLSGVISRHGNRYQLGGSTSGLVTIKLLSEQSAHSLNSHATQLRQPQALTSAAATIDVSHVVDIAIVVDSQYNDLHNGNGLEKALSIINSVDGIYREEFGIALRVISALNVTERSSDPFDFGNVQIETMLRGLRDYRMQSTQFNDASLVHLFTGNQNSDAPVGLAWIDTACRTDGYDVGLSTPYRHEILLAAHEIAHNLGAMHDTETACSIQTDKVMWPYISNQTSQNFSVCTRSSVRQALQNSCHVETVDLQVSLVADDVSTYTATVRNNDATLSSISSTLSFKLPENTIATALNGDCATPDNQLECSIKTLHPGAEDHVKLYIENFDDEALQALVASVDSNGIPDLIADNNTATIYNHTDAIDDETLDEAQPVVTPQTPTRTGEGTNDGFMYIDGGGSVARFLLALGIIHLALRRRARQRLS